MDQNFDNLDEISSLIEQKKLLRSHLWSLQEKMASEFIDPRSVPPDHRRAEEVLHEKIAEIDARLLGLQQRSTFPLPIIIAAMTDQQAAELLDGRVKTRLGDQQQTIFTSFFSQIQSINLLQNYSKDQDSWVPHAFPYVTIKNIINEMVGFVNDSALDQLLIEPVFLSEDFFSDDRLIRINTVNLLADRGGIIIVDAVSLFHPEICSKLFASAINNPDIALIVISPINYIINSVNQLIEDFLAVQMDITLSRFELKLDPLCEIGIGDLRTLKRTLFSILNREISYALRPKAINIQTLRNKVGYSSGSIHSFINRGL